MLDQYSLDDVLDPPTKSGSVSPQVSAACAPRNSAQQVLNALLTFDVNAEKTLSQWSGLTAAQADTATVTAVDWAGLMCEVQISLLCGDTEHARLEAMDIWLQECPLAEAQAVRSAVALFRHLPKQSVELYEAAGENTTNGLPALCYALAQIQLTAQSLTATGADQFSLEDKHKLEQLHTILNSLSREYQKRFAGDRFIPVLKVLVDFVRVVSGERKIKDTLWLGGLHIDASPWLDLFIGLARHWLGEKPDETQIERLAAHVDSASGIGMHWFVDEALSLVSILGLQREDAIFQPQIRSVGWLLNVYQIESDWQGALDVLNLTAKRHSRLNAQHKPLAGNRRLGWWVESQGTRLQVEPRELRLEKNGQWSPGKHFPLKLLLDECGTLDFLCDHDLKICAHLRNQVQINHALNFEQSFTFATAESLDLLIDHPRLYRRTSDDTDDVLPTQLSVQLETPALHVIANNAMQEVTVSMLPYPEGDIHCADDFSCYWKNHHTLIIHRFSEGQLDISRALTFNGLSVPAEGSDALLDSLRSLASIAEIHSDITKLNSDSIAPKRKLTFHLRPLDIGLHIECRIYPLGETGPCVLPGAGKPGLHAVIGKQPRNTVRDFAAELQEAEQVLNLLAINSNKNTWQWTLDNSESALELSLIHI